jgi:TonB family protein
LIFQPGREISHWNDLLAYQVVEVAGKVVLRFRLNSDGSVSDLRLLQNQVNNTLEKECEQGIKEAAPFGQWPPEMFLELASDHYDITFTFNYAF